MSQTLGSLVVSLEANMASFNRSMNEASQRTEASMKRMDAALGVAKVAVGALIGAASVGALSVLVKGAIDAADNLRDMSQKTGIAVEELNGLGFAASQSGGSLESMVAAAGKLNKSIAESQDPASKSADAFKALGISTLDASGNLKKADVVMAEVADQFAKYQDGPEKAALALALFGKAGADMIPQLNEGGSAMRENIAYAMEYSGQTTELSNASDNFNDTLGKLNIQQKGFANAMSAELLPILQQIADAMLGAAEQSNGFERAAGLVGVTLKQLSTTAAGVVLDFKQIGTGVEGMVSISKALASGSLEDAKAARESMLQTMSDMERAHDQFRNGILNGKAASPFKDAMAMFDRGIIEEKKLLATRLAMLNKYRADDIEGDKEYNRGKAAALDDNLAKTRGFYMAQMITLKDQMNALRKFAKGNSNDSVIAQLQSQFDATQLNFSLVGADKPRAPRLPVDAKKSPKAGKSEAEKALEAGAKLVANLQKQEGALGLTGVALLTYNMQVDKASESDIRLAVASQKVMDKFKSDQDMATARANNIKADGEAQQKALDQNRANVEQIRQSLLSEVDAAAEMHAMRLEELKSFRDAELESEIQGNALIEAERARHEQAKADMQAAYNMQSVQMAGDVAGQLYGLMQQAGKEQSALGKAMFLVSKGLAVAEILMNTHVAASKAGAQLGIFGIPMSSLILAQGYASAGMVAGMAIAEASAEGGYDIPSGKNPVTQLHEREMVLPRAQADVIRGLAVNGGGSGKAPNITVVNNGSPLRVVNTQRIAPDEWAMIVEDAKNATAASFSDPNSKTSRSLARNFNVPRTR